MLREQDGKLVGVCEYCGAIIHRKPCRLNRAKLHFCDEICHDHWFESLRITGNCDYCGEPITRSAAVWNRTQYHFCNLICYGKWVSKNHLGPNHPKWSQVETICDYCGTPIHVQLWFFKQFKHHFCNEDCHDAWQRGENNGMWKGGYEPYYGPNWESQRKRARERDFFCCRLCGISEKELGRELSVHHFIPFRQFGTEEYELANSLSNLCCVCPEHHNKLERLSLQEQIQRAF